MKAISLKLPEDLLEDSGHCAEALDLSRAQYIRKAIEKMNTETRTRFRAKRMAEASLRVREESMRVNAEFAAIEEDLGA
jgi:metal-responsive CopG/Arc/MetJ family transcriptional regulator